MKKALRLFLAALLFEAALIAPLLAAVTANSPITVQAPKLALVQINNGDGTTPQTLYSCGSNGSKIVAMFAATTDTSADTLQVSIVRSSTTYLLETVTVPLSSGNAAGTPPQPLMGPLYTPGLPVDLNNNQYLYCQSGDTLEVGATSAVTSSKIVSVWAVVGDF